MNTAGRAAASKSFVWFTFTNAAARVAVRAIGPKRTFALTLGVELLVVALLGTDEDLNAITREVLGSGER